MKDNSRRRNCAQNCNSSNGAESNPNLTDRLWQFAHFLHAAIIVATLLGSLALTIHRFLSILGIL